MLVRASYISCRPEVPATPFPAVGLPCLQVFFYIDPEFATDPKMNGINIITLRWASTWHALPGWHAVRVRRSD